MFSWLFRKHGIIIQTAEYSMQYRECVPLDGRTENRRSVPWEGENSLFSSCLQIWCVGSTEIFIQDLCRSKETRVWRTIYLHLVGYSFLYLTHLTYKGYTWSVRKVSDLWPGKRNWLTWSVGHLITLIVVPLGLHTLLPAVPPLLEACRKSLFRNGV